MYHHAAAYINTDVRNAGNVIGALKKDKVAGLCLRRRYGGTDIVKPLCAKPSHVPTAVIDYPRYKAAANFQMSGGENIPADKARRAFLPRLSFGA